MTPDCLQRLRYYDGDDSNNMVDLMGSSNATGYLFEPLLFIYVLFF
jgi:hypothetical protein